MLIVCRVQKVNDCCGAAILHDFLRGYCGCSGVMVYNVYCMVCFRGFDTISNQVEYCHTKEKRTLFTAYIKRDDSFWVEVRKALVENGFIYVTEFRNANSGNVVEVWNLNTEDRHYRDGHYKVFDGDEDEQDEQAEEDDLDDDLTD